MSYLAETDAAGAALAANLKDLVGEADRALYRAKESGRNRVCIA